MAKCSFSGCTKIDILRNDCHVEVKTVLPTGYGSKFLSRMKVKWRRNGEASFHRTCWDVLLKAARARRHHSHLPDISTEEKCLLKEAAKTAEFFDSLQQVQESAAKCASLIKSAKHFTAFTGAGISTSAGLGDFRGKSGKWTQMDQNDVDMDAVFAPISGDDSAEQQSTLPKSEPEEVAEDDGGGFVSYESLRPTYTHEALQKLMEKGYLKYVISQNCDGLHGLSGIPHDNLSELHGNVFVEICEKCGARYTRPYYAMNDKASLYYEEMEDYGSSDVKKPKFAAQCNYCGLTHRTGHKCEKQGCIGYLKDSIINFGDNLEDHILDRATQNAKDSDLMICLGSTLTVTPANSLVEMTREPHNLIICNRQGTHMDGSYGNGVRVFGNCDSFMREVMRCVLDPSDLQEWEDGRQKRLRHYDTQRVSN